MDKSVKKLLSLPPNLVDKFHKLTGLPAEQFFCTSDPIGHRLGSGGGTTWLLEQCHRSHDPESDFSEWLGNGKRILLHAGGQSRRLPSYAPSGKILTPIPIFRWERGQKLGQTLLDLQLPLYEHIMEKAPEGIHTMIVSGDVYIRGGDSLPSVPDADVVCYGLWLDASIAKDHGVFYMKHGSQTVLDHMLQKPSVDTLNELLQTGYYLTDIGIWLLSDRAVELLRHRSRRDGEIVEYDLYSEFGCSLGENPLIADDELSALKVAIVPLTGGEFYHFGTSGEMISSMLAIQNRISDQREIMHRDRKPHPSIFVQNSITRRPFTRENSNIWVENSYIGEKWSLSHDHVITGVPENDWALELKPGQCVDIVPIGEKSYVVRPYDINAKFAGDEQRRPCFPVVDTVEQMGQVLKEMLAAGTPGGSYRLMSAEEISDTANLQRLVAQRDAYRSLNWSALASNHEHSVFYQADLQDAASYFATHEIPLPEPLPERAPLMRRMHDAMFRASALDLMGKDGREYDREAFGLLREGLLKSSLESRQSPRMDVQADQIVWSRSPVRIDLAGGWTDTPPFCLLEGGDVVNIAIELNGQQPLQAYVKPCPKPHIVCRSIDLGATEEIDTFAQLRDFNRVKSPFSIPKAALALAGFLPEFCNDAFSSLEEQLKEFGCGIEITLFSAIPAGSGLGTSSILASTVLGAVSDFCHLGWDKNEICMRTLVLEQLLTSGGGWQDQFGGVFGGVKLLQTERGFMQNPQIRWLPDNLFTDAEYAPCHVLYYTGITRTAKDILAQIVRRMFLNEGEQIELLRRMKAHAIELFEAVQRQDFEGLGRLVRYTWKQNRILDLGTNPPEIQALTKLIDDLCLGYKLPGAGGGGYLYMIAKDAEAASRIRQRLHAASVNPNARFVDMRLSKSGLQVTRS